MSGVRQKEGGVTLKEHLNLLAGHVALQQVDLKFLVRYYQSSLFETVIYIWVLRLDFRSQGTWLLLGLKIGKTQILEVHLIVGQLDHRQVNPIRLVVPI